MPVLQCGGKAIQGPWCCPIQDSACHAELRAVTGAENDAMFRDIVHGTFLVCAFVRQRQHARRLSYQEKTPLPEMRHTPNGELLERTNGELSSPLPWRERREEELEEEPELPAHSYANGRNPTQTQQASAGERALRVRLRALSCCWLWLWCRLVLHALTSYVSVPSLIVVWFPGGRMRRSDRVAASREQMQASVQLSVYVYRAHRVVYYTA